MIVQKKMAKKTTLKTAEENSKVTAQVAVVDIGGKQYLVKAGDSLLIEKITGQKSINLPDLLGGKEVTLKVGEDEKGKKISIWKFKNKTRYLKRMGHRQKYTRVEVESIK